MQANALPLAVVVAATAGGGTLFAAGWKIGSDLADD